MSRGSPIVNVRVPQEVLDLVNETITRRNLWSRNPPWTTSGFFISAIREKIEKMKRSRRPRT